VEEAVALSIEKSYFSSQGDVAMTDKKPDESPNAGVILIDAIALANASTSANTVVHELVKQFSKDYGQNAAEVDKATKKSG
jgi:hypothetical protein